jgi:dUTP pyrophosphatase
MDKSNIDDYVNRLREIENSLESDDVDFSLISDLNKVLLAIDNDIQNNAMSINTSLKIRLKKLNPTAVTPSYSKDGDAGMDLTSTTIISHTTDQVTYGTGISLEIPKDYVGLVFPRSSIRKYDLELTNSVGVIDSGYRGEIQLTFNKVNSKTTIYNVGDRVGQIMIIPYPKINFVESDELTITERGEDGFGSSGS